MDEDDRLALTVVAVVDLDLGAVLDADGDEWHGSLL
jgi:hypothetical protein